jgi:hypothetical protein
MSEFQQKFEILIGRLLFSLLRNILYSGDFPFYPVYKSITSAR